MATFTQSDSLAKQLEKLAAVPPTCPERSFIYSVKGCEIESADVTASSAFKAASKFAIWAKQVCCFQLEPMVTCIEVLDPEKDRYVYDIVLDGNKALVELKYFEKNSPVFDNTSRVDPCSDDEDELQNVNIDLQTGDLIDNTLKHYFGFTSFRPLQRETIIATMSKKDSNVMTVVGTGGGKSLTYFLPVVLSSKTTVVVSPIKSLIDDILSRCEGLNISACKFTGDIPKETYQSQLVDLERFKIVLVTPEIIKDGDLLDTIVSLAEKGNLERIVFDEAHTIVSWGNTFRPVYKEVCESIAKLSCPKLLLSATVPAKVEADIKVIFNDLMVFRSSIFRENLNISVCERGTKFYDDLESLLSEHKGECGIIYCVLPKDVSQIHAELLKRGICCVKYHGQLSTEMKLINQMKWMTGECKLIVANSSFGMGIDKKDVRYVIHARMPTSIDEFFQQCGRAGRDGLLAKCTIFYKYADKNLLLKMFIHQGNVDKQMEAVNDLVHFLEDPVQCRHKILMAYFGECRSNFVCGGSCDNCVDSGCFYATDGTNDALKVVQAVVELTGKTITCNMLKLFLLGSKQKIIQEESLDSLSNFGLFKKRFAPAVLLEKFLPSLIYHGVLAEITQQKGRSISLNIQLGPKAHDLLALNMNVTRFEKK